MYKIARTYTLKMASDLSESRLFRMEQMQCKLYHNIPSALKDHKK